MLVLTSRRPACKEAELVEVIGLFIATSTNGFFKLVCNVNIVYGYLKSENSQDYAQKPQPALVALCVKGILPR